MAWTLCKKKSDIHIEILNFEAIGKRNDMTTLQKQIETLIQDIRLRKTLPLVGDMAARCLENNWKYPQYHARSYIFF